LGKDLGRDWTVWDSRLGLRTVQNGGEFMGELCQVEGLLYERLAVPGYDFAGLPPLDVELGDADVLSLMTAGPCCFCPRGS
jgi:hypothetical protein